MHHFRRLSALWRSFYSRDLYREIVFKWRGIGLVYLMLMLGLLWLPSAARWFLALRAYGAATAETLVRELPTISIRGGVMTARPSGRHVILLESSQGGSGDDTILIIDDTVESVSSEIAVQAVVLTQREVGAVRPSRGERRVWTLTPGADMEVTPEEAGAFVSSLAFWVSPVAYISAVVGSVAFRMIQALLYCAIAMAYASAHRAKLEYANSVRLAVVAVTPVVVIRTLVWFGPWEPAWYWRWPAALLITLAYIRFGIRAAATAPSDAVHPPADYQPT